MESGNMKQLVIAYTRTVEDKEKCISVYNDLQLLNTVYWLMHTSQKIYSIVMQIELQNLQVTSHEVQHEDTFIARKMGGAS